MVSVETILGIRGGRIKENEGEDEFKCGIVDILQEFL
jgi:hypothetical protein